jgi:hypothetical protein
MLTEADLLNEIAAKPEATAIPDESKNPEAPPAEVEPGITPPEPIRDPEKFVFDLKVNGTELKKEYTRDELIRELQKVSSSAKQYEEASQIRKDMEGLLGSLKDPTKAENVLLRLLGREGVVALSQKYLADEYDKSQWSEEQRKLHTENEELRYKQELIDKELSETRSEKENVAIQREMDDLTNQFIESAKKFELPNEKRIYAVMADVMRFYGDQGKDITADEAAKITRDNIQVDLMRYVNGSNVEAIANLLGEDTIKKINKWSIDKVRTVPKPPEGSNFAKGGKSASKLQEKIKEADYDTVMREIFNSSGN